MPRQKKTDRDLPACVYRKHGAIWYVKGGKWTRLGDAVGPALAAYARMIAAADRRETAPERMPSVLFRWLDDKKLAAATRATYEIAARRLADIFAEFRPDQITARDITATMHHYRDTPGMANHMRNVMLGALEFAYMENLVERNVARDTRPLKTAARTRYITDREFDAIRTAASPTMRAIMDLLFYSGQRVSDVLAIRYSDLTDEGVLFTQQKTGNRLLVAWSPELRQAVEAARALHQSVRGLTLIHSRRGTPLTYSTVRSLWDRATAAAGIENARMHDLRAKAGTDADKQGLDSKKLLGHKSESSHLRYLRSKDTPIATPPKLGPVLDTPVLLDKKSKISR